MCQRHGPQIQNSSNSKKTPTLFPTWKSFVGGWILRGQVTWTFAFEMPQFIQSYHVVCSWEKDWFCDCTTWKLCPTDVSARTISFYSIPSSVRTWAKGKTTSNCHCAQWKFSRQTEQREQQTTIDDMDQTDVFAIDHHSTDVQSPSKPKVSTIIIIQ